jgi:hypothetical protein
MLRLIFLLLITLIMSAYASSLLLVRVQYDGGGDWYNDPEILINLSQEMKKRTGISVQVKTGIVDLKSDAIMNYPFIFLTGHGGIRFSPAEASRLREYLSRGGFLYVDDDYGMDKSFREAIKTVFPENDLKELPASHPIFHCFYDFPKGLPKTHLHDDKRPQALGIFLKNRLVLLYTYESNISDGWADPSTHNDTPETRETAFRMGINMLYYILTQ